MTAPGRILALDIGDARTGVAVTDELQTMAFPHAVVQAPSREKALAALVKIIADVQPVRIVAGLPLEESGALGRQAARVRTFAGLLQERVDVEVVFEDERYTTLAADEVLTRAGLRGRKRRGVVDKVAAAQILESYLERMRRERKSDG